MSLMRNLLGFGSPSSIPGPLGTLANLFQMFQRFSSNPIGALMGMNVNVPPHLRNNPEATVNYLRNSGQMTEEQFNQFSQLANQFQSILQKKF